MSIIELPLFNLLLGTLPDNPPLPMSPHILAEITGSQLIAIAGIAANALVASVVIIYGLKFVKRRKELWHETARIALEKGQPIPPMSEAKPSKTDANSEELRYGLVFIASGAGLALFLGTVAGSGLAYIGAIPGFIGVALLLNALINTRRKRTETPPADRPPQS